MRLLHLPWLELAMLAPLVGAAWVARASTPDAAHRRATQASGLTLLLTIAVALDYAWLGRFEAHEQWDLSRAFVDWDGFVIDALSAPLLPLTAVIYWVTILATPREKSQRFGFPGALAAESITLAALSCREPRAVAGLLALGIVPPWLELRARGGSTRSYVAHAASFLAALAAGGTMASGTGIVGHLGVALLVLACLLRAGVPPFHSWIMELFEKGTFGGALLFAAPLIGAYGVMRLVVPLATPALLFSVVLLSLISALVASGLTLVQNDIRRLFGWLAVGQVSMVFVGLDVGSPVSTAGALSVWLSAALSLTGLGLVLRAMEARIGRFSLERFLGLYSEVPTLAALFLLTGLALVGFPGTVGFVGLELLVDGSATVYPVVGLVIVIASAVNGIALMRAYFRAFTGADRPATPGLEIRLRERVAVLLLSGLVIGGGLFPQLGVGSRYHAAIELKRRSEEGRRAGPPAGSESAASVVTPAPPASTENAPRVGAAVALR